MRILLADDHEIVRRGLRSLLESRDDWRICGEATDGNDAVEKTRALDPDIVILDIAMPNLNGFAAAKLIKQHSPATQILLYSIHYSRAFVEEAQRIGVMGYVSKSEGSASFLMAVDSVRRSRPYFTAVSAASTVDVS
jgi:DNA-binding NarL/FixJ family response regulator